MANLTGNLNTIFDYDVYEFSRVNNGWMIGTDPYFGDNPTDDQTDGASCNAYKMGNHENFGKCDYCPENLKIPSELTSQEGLKLPVEIIGAYAFFKCGQEGKTKNIFITKQIKVIKQRGLGDMFKATSFAIESGSQLEEIHKEALYKIGYLFDSDNEDQRITLYLPSSLKIVEENGIYCCYLFNTVTYCGEYQLTNSSKISDQWISQSSVKVSSKYNFNSCLGQEVFSRDADEECLRAANEGYGWETNNNSAIVTGWYDGFYFKICPPDGNITIPDRLGGMKVVAIANESFANCTTRGPILLPPSIEEIGARAFAGMRHATAIDIPSSANLRKIGEAVFADCGAEEDEEIKVVISGTVEVEKYAFKGAKIGEFHIF